DDTALVHSVFAIVAARLRKKHNGSKGFIKKVSEYDKLGQTHYDNSTTNNRNIHENKSKSHQTSKQIHQHIKLASYTSNDLTKQAKYKEMNNNDEQQSWHLCIKWNPNQLSNQSTFNSINLNDQNKTLSNETTHQLKLKKTHILATLVNNYDYCSRQISKNIDHIHNYDHDHDHDRDQCKYRSKIMMNSLDQTNSTTMLHCQQCLFKMNKGYMKQRYLNGQCNNNNNNNNNNNKAVNDNSTSTMLCCSHCNQWFIPLWNQQSQLHRWLTHYQEVFFPY
ncbi:unnamed protein product, partial [Schistosoma mattheei]